MPKNKTLETFEGLFLTEYSFRKGDKFYIHKEDMTRYKVLSVLKEYFDKHQNTLDHCVVIEPITIVYTVFEIIDK